MNDKDWLQKVSLAFEVYRKQVEDPLPVQDFIKWLYKQYGIIQPKKD